jgi:Fe-S-cluster containining protein
MPEELTAGHTLDEDGEHDEDACYKCLADRPAIVNVCRCGECCRRLIIEVLLEDAEREPKIKEMGSPLKGFDGEQIGYWLNAKDGPCVFLDRASNRCTIYETRPLLCRLFSCDGEAREELVQLGILPPREERT